MNSNPKRRWYQFSLRTMFTSMTVICVALAAVAIKLGQAQDQRIAVQAIRQFGGMVWYDYHLPSDGSFDKAASPPGPQWLLKLVGEDFRCNVMAVQLVDSPIDDGNLTHLRGLRSLKYLQIVRTQVTDAGLTSIRDLRNLKSLTIAGPSVTNAGLTNLAAMKDLASLNIADTSVTDVGLTQLQGLTKLTMLNPRDTLITDVGLAELHEVLPNLTVEYGEFSDAIQ